MSATFWTLHRPDITETSFALRAAIDVTYFDDSTTIPMLLERRASEDAEWPLCRFNDVTVSVGELAASVSRLASGLIGLGVRRGDRVAVMLPNHPDHLITLLAVIKAGAVWVPINVHLRGKSLAYVLDQSEPRALIADESFRDVLGSSLARHRPRWLIWRGSGTVGLDGHELRLDELMRCTEQRELPTIAAHDVVCISFTSGTTGEPKGVLVTDKMLRAAATGARLGGDIRDGDVLLVWEPLYHIGGSQIVILALTQRIQLTLLERFSASQFWDQARTAKATHMHHLGGILQMLLKQPPTESDRDHPVHVSWGGGCSIDVWREFERRFGVQIRELYGMTEASSISTVNGELPRVGSIGKPLPYFEVRVVDESGADCRTGQLGELVIRGREPGLITPGYYRNPTATSVALRDGWLHTGDLARIDEDLFLYYGGRTTDSVRHRGENISAWEVERVINEHPGVEECALVGVSTDIGEQDLKLFIKLAAGVNLDPSDLIAWCQNRLPSFQVPRYVAFVDEFAKTPTLRIKKEQLSRSTDGVWDRHAEAR